MNELEEEVLALWREVLELPDFGFDDNFFEAGGTHEQGFRLISRLEQRFNKVYHLSWILAAPTPREQTRWLQSVWMEGYGEPPFPEQEPDPAAWREHFQSAFPIESIRQVAAGDRLPQVCFIHSPGRSGSTLLRTMLAGHPDLFAPPELELLLFPDMQTRHRGLLEGWADLHGLNAAVTALWSCTEEETSRLIQQWHDDNLSTFEVFRLLQDRARPRLLVDKTPSSASVEAALLRCEAWFSEPLYIHLVRHPLASIRSWKNSHFEQVLHAPPRSAAEVNWLLSHQNVLNLLGHLGEDRLIQIRYEDLVTEPEKTMRRLARFLKIEYQDSLLDPYTGDRMTKYSSGRIGGDKKFHLRRSIDRSGADGARRLPEDGQLLPETVGLARSFGYTDL